MKLGYVKPTIEFEDFALNAAIAAACQVIVSLGPGDATHHVCKEYDQSPWFVRPGLDPMGSDPIDITFYESSCSCYLSSVGSTLLSS